MNIVYFLPASNVGGAETIVVNTIKELKKEHLVTLVINYTYDSALLDNLDKSGIDYVSLKPKWALNLTNRNILFRVVRHLFCKVDDLLMPLKIRLFIKKNNFDIIHIHLSILELFPRISGVNIFYTCHSDFDRYIKVYGKKWFKKYEMLSKSGMTTIGLNQKMISTIKNYVPYAKVYYLPNWIDVKAFKSISISKERLCQEMGVPSDSKLIGHIGRLDPVKNHKKSISIFSNILNTYGSKYYLLIVGDGDKEYLRKLKILCNELHVEQNVLFLGYRADIGNIVSMLDYSLLTSYNEGFPLTALELQTFGVRCVFSNAVPEEVICNSNCFRLSIDEDDSVWAYTLVEGGASEYNKNLLTFDKEYVLNQLIKMYYEVKYGDDKK